MSSLLPDTPTHLGISQQVCHVLHHGRKIISLPIALARPSSSSSSCSSCRIAAPAGLAASRLWPLDLSQDCHPVAMGSLHVEGGREGGSVREKAEESALQIPMGSLHIACEEEIACEEVNIERDSAGVG